MSEGKHYPNAPIREAIIDLRVTTGEGVTLEDLKQLHDSIRTDYPTGVGMNLIQGRIQFGPESSSTTETGTRQVGYRFASDDKKQIFSAHLDGFNFSRLHPYERWETFRDEARRLWNLYRKAASIKSVNRVSVRYVNRIDIPERPLDLRHFFRTYPEVSDAMTYNAFAGMFMQLVIPQVDIHSVAQLTQALIEPADPHLHSVILDIDLFREDAVPSSDDEIWSLFDVLRARKNEIFEACITPKAEVLFQ